MKVRRLRKFFSLFDIVVCLVMAVCFSVSSIYQINSEYSLKFNKYMLTKFVICSILFFVLTICTRMCFFKVIEKEEKTKLDKLFESKYSLFVIASILFVCWLPIICILYPGSLNNDGWGQIKHIHYNLYTDQHPLLDTFIIGGFIYKVAALFKENWHAAMFLYTMLQTIIMSFVLAYTLIYAKTKLKLNGKLLFCCMIIYGILPAFPCTIQAISKDTLFSWIYILFFINYLEMIRTKGQNLEKTKTIIITIILSLLCSYTKRIGIYVVLISYFVFLLMHIKSWKPLFFCMIVTFCIMMMFRIINQYFSVFYIISDGNEGKYSLLFQQTARYAVYYEKDTTQQEKEVINKVLKYDTIAQNYNSLTSDSLKDNHVKGSSSTDYINYLGVWLKQGLRNPKVYLDATLAMTSGWFSLNEYKPLMNMDWHDQLDENAVPKWIVQRPRENREIAKWFEEKYDKLSNLPILNVIVTFGFVTSILPVFAFSTVILYRKNKDNKKVWIGSVPTIISIILGCWLAPISSGIEGVRYIYPILFTNMLLILWCFYTIKEYMIDVGGEYYGKKY